MRDFGARAALEQLQVDADRDEIVRATCHALTHVIAHAAARRAGEPRPVGDLGELCGSGYDTGRMEVFVASAASERTLDQPDTLCAYVRLRAPRSNAHYTCVHALGHGLMQKAAGDLTTALSGCDRLTGSWEREGCYTGAFMENVTRSAKRWKTQHRLRYPCTVMPHRYLAACYDQQAAYLLFATGDDIDRAFRICATADDPRARRTCYEGLGIDTAARSIADHITEAGAAAGADIACDAGSTRDARSNCIVGAARQLVDHFHNQRAETLLCNLVEAALSTTCRNAGRAYYATLADPPGVTPPWTAVRVAHPLLCVLPV